MCKTSDEGNLQKSAPTPDSQNAARERVRKTLREMAKAHWEANPLIVGRGKDAKRPVDTARSLGEPSEEENGER